jgi:hypothetical protein
MRDMEKRKYCTNIECNEPLWRKWSIGTVSLLAIAAFVIAGVNYFIDPFGVFGGDKFRRDAYLNERYVKVEYFLNNQGKYDALFLGSSVVGLFDTDLVGTLTGYRYYNLGFMSGMPLEDLKLLKALKERGYVPKAIMMPIDLFQFNGETLENSNPTRYEHPIISGSSEFVFKMKYLLASGPNIWMKKISRQMSANPDFLFDVERTGTYRLLGKDREIAANHAAYMKKEFTVNLAVAADVVFVEKRFAELRELRKWLQDNNVKATFFFSPMSHKSRNAISNRSAALFKSKIESVLGSIPDFAVQYLPNENFYDDRHPRPIICNDIARRLFAKNS